MSRFAIVRYSQRRGAGDGTLRRYTVHVEFRHKEPAATECIAIEFRIECCEEFQCIPDADGERVPRHSVQPLTYNASNEYNSGFIKLMLAERKIVATTKPSPLSRKYRQ